jgi:hypothetical protein
VGLRVLIFLLLEGMKVKQGCETVDAFRYTACPVISGRLAAETRMCSQAAGAACGRCPKHVASAGESLGYCTGETATARHADAANRASPQVRARNG